MADKSAQDFDCYLHEVKYDDGIMDEDFFTKKFPNANQNETVIKCLFYKRKAFEHEEEVRLVLYSKKDRPKEDVYHIYYEPNNLISEILLNPRINEETEKLYITTIRKKFGFNGIAAKSELYSYKRQWYTPPKADQ